MKQQLASSIAVAIALLMAHLTSMAAAAEPLLEKTDLFTAGEDGYALYRIPGMVVTKQGTVLAYCEARRTGKTDWDTIDILLRRSTDGGKTWSARQKMADVPGPKTKNPVALAQKLGNPDDVTYNNPVAIVDRSGAVHFLFCLEYARCFYLRSDDDGMTWSKPVEITAKFEQFRSDYDWKVLATGPAHGIQLRSGRLVVPVWLSTGTGGHAHRPSVTATIYSDDHGATWQRGEIAVPNTETWIFPNETVIAELVNGDVMLNVRSEAKQHRRLITKSKDGATGWTRPRFDEALLEPICMASLVRYSKRPEADRNRLLFCNPHTLDRLDGKEVEGKSRDRRNLSIKLSYDEGKTWPVNKTLEAGYGAYSDLAVLPDGTALCLYERGRDSDMEKNKPTSYAWLTLARFNLQWLTDGKDQLKGPLDGKTDFGGKREDFPIAGVEGFVIHPTRPAAGGAKPWVWYAPTIGNHPSPANAWLLTRLLDRGFYVAGVYLGETYANPRSRQQMDAFHQHVVKTYGLDPKACLLAQSRGGLNHYNFAADHPDRVRCIAGIYTVGDLRSYPGLERAAPAYGMTAAELEAALDKHNPVARLEPIAKAKIPILHLHGDADRVVPIEQNSQAIRDRYRALGGEMELIVVPDKGHQNDPGFFESQAMLEFLLKQGLASPSPGASTAAGESRFETTCVFPVTPLNKPNYRIPALVVAPNGDLLVFAEKRNDGPGDIGNHDIVLKRSRDQGRTWSAEHVIFDDGDRVSTDITVGRDRDTNRLWLFFLRDKKQFACFTSDDNGVTWQGPRLIHDQVAKPEWDKLPGKPRKTSNPLGRMAMWEKDWHQRYGVGPGNAMIQLSAGPHAGRLIVPARHREDVGNGRLRSFSHCFFSDDHGANWQRGGTVGENTSECQLVELAGGEVMLMARNESAADSPDNLRHLASISRDGGMSWSEPRRAEELVTPRCHGAIERASQTADHGKPRLLFSSPGYPHREERHPYGRYNLTVRSSEDEGLTWSTGRTIWPAPSSYSDLAVLGDGTIGLVYERGPAGSTHYWDEIHFARFDLDWLTANSPPSVE